MKKIIFFLVFITALASCTNNNFEQILFRTTEDPFSDVPVTDSLTLEKNIYLSWEEDDASDVFFLMRSLDQSILDFKCIYTGTETSYVDTFEDSDGRYIYRLDKKRGNARFYGENYAYGFSAACRRDKCEDNDIESKASYLEYDLICNLPCVQYLTNNELYMDEDWFYVSVPPRRSAEIIISQAGLNNTSEEAETNLMLQKAGSIEEAVLEKKAIYLSNPGNQTKDIYFKVFPNKTSLFSASAATTVIEYTVSLNSILNYTL